MVFANEKKVGKCRRKSVVEIYLGLEVVTKKLQGFVVVGLGIIIFGIEFQILFE